MKSTKDIKKYNNRNNKCIIIFIIIVASILGSIYAAYINLNDLQYTTVIYLWINNHKDEINIAIIFSIWVKYFKRIFIVWISSFYRVTYVLAYIVLFWSVFSSSFTFVTLLMILSKLEVAVVILCCFIEMIITIGLMVEILNNRECIEETSKYIKKDIVMLIKDAFICAIISMVDMFIINMILV